MQKIRDAIKNNVFNESSRINSTFGGNLVDMVRFTIYLEIIEKENLFQQTPVMLCLWRIEITRYKGFIHAKLINQAPAIIF